MRPRIYAWIVALLTGACLPLVAYAFLNLEVSSGDVSPWMPENTKDRQTYDRFAELFQTHDTLLVSWEGCDAHDMTLTELSRLIRKRDLERAKKSGEPELIGSLTSLSGLIDTLEKKNPPGLTPDWKGKLSDGFSGSLIAKDGETGVLVIESSEFGADRRDETFQFVEGICEEFVPPETDLRFAGPCFLAVCANEETTKVLVYITPITSLISLLVAFIFLRSFTWALLAFGISGFAAALVITAIHFSGNALGDMIAVVPSLAQLLGMSNVVHLINYYMESLLHQGDSRAAWRHAIRKGFLPTVAASVTTMLGFLALLASPMPAAQDFARIGSLGVLITMVTVLLLTPAALILLRPRAKPPLPVQTAFVSGLIWITSKKKWAVAGVLMGLFVFAAVGLGQLRPDARMESIFPEESRFQKDYRWFQDRFGDLQSSELLVTFEPWMPRTLQVAIVRKLTGKIHSLGYPVYSPSLFLEVFSRDDALTGSSPMNTKAAMAGYWQDMTMSGLVASNGEGDHWRISIRHAAEPDPNDSVIAGQIDKCIADMTNEFTLDGLPEPMRKALWGDFAGQLFPDGDAPGVEERAAISNFLQAKPGSPLPVSIQLTGAHPLISKAQASLVNQLLRTFLLAFFFITPVLMILVRSLRLGLVAILGNLFPLVVFFGLMGWIGIRIDIATMMIAAVAFGIAVDDTVHFLVWLVRGMRKEHELNAAVTFAFHQCAGAILQTTLIISLGMLAFLLGDYRPSVRFGLFSSIVLMIALVGDLLLLPAMILGPLARFFGRKNS